MSNANKIKPQLGAIGDEIVLDRQLDGYECFYSSDPFGNWLDFMERLI